ncbi:MAG TPA: AmmeMemoRadiSam system protein B [Acidobacteriota bacterium]|nr:AmmeMemoRadiSam system protein B [Acidobacteriota bacterium]
MPKLFGGIVIRPPAVAGAFYPGTDSELRVLLQHLTSFPAQKSRAVALIGPHAGYIYSGKVAGETYARVELPDKFIILCPNHTGRGAPVAIMSDGFWRTPLGEIPIDADLANQLKKASDLFEEDGIAHQMEHSLEVHLPFLQFLKQKFTFVPINVGTGNLEALRQIGLAVAKVVAQSTDPVLIISSTDMTHYEPADQARAKDEKAIQAMLDLDATKLFDTVHHFHISMCGYAPTTATLFAAKQLGARRAELIRYANSGDVSGDHGSVVGYAGLVIR